MRLVLSLLVLLLPTLARADSVSVAVAANFSAPMKEIAAAFERSSGHRVILSLGSTGKLYAQIRNGAPFDLFLAADRETPTMLVAEGAALGEGRMTYAEGRLVLWSARSGYVDPEGRVLGRHGFRHLAIANPKLAPYGQAALEVLTALGLLDSVTPRLVRGESIAQTYQFVASGAAELGFVALAQVTQDGRIGEGSAWVVPAELHQPIRQDAVVLARSRDKAAARALLAFLGSEPARRVIRAYGYDLAPGGR